MKYLLTLLIAFSFIACNGGGGSSTGIGTGTGTGGTSDPDFWSYDSSDPRSRAQQFVDYLNNRFSASYTLIKEDTLSGPNYIVVDAILSTGTRILRAYNLDEVEGDTSPNTEGYDWFQVEAFDIIVNDQGIVTETIYIDEAGFLYESKSQSIKDLEKVGAGIEKIQREVLADQLNLELGLSMERSFEVSGLIKAWDKIAKNKGVTDSDAEAFSEELLGFSISEFQSAVKDQIEGKADAQANLQELLNKASDKNGLSPEEMNGVISDFFLN